MEIKKYCSLLLATQSIIGGALKYLANILGLLKVIKI